MTSAAFTQGTFRGRNDLYGVNVDNGWLAGLGLDWTQDTATIFRVRFVIQETNNKSVNNQQFKLFASYDGGAYTTEVTPTSNYARVIPSTNAGFNDGDTTTQLIGSGSYVIGESVGADEDGQTGNIDYDGNDEAELEFCLYIPHIAAYAGKAIRLRVYDAAGDPINSYTDEPAITVSMLAGHPTSLTAGNVIKGGNILKTSGGTYYGVFHDGSGGLKIWKDLFGSPTSAGTAAASVIFGGGSIDWLSAAMDSNDDIQIVAAGNSEQTRDVAFRIFDTGTDSWAGSWVQAFNYTATPTDNQVHIAVDVNNDAHIVCCDLQSGVDQVFYTNNVSGWLTPERVNTSTGLNNSDPVIVCDPSTSTDVHVFYYADGNNDPAYRKRTGGSWGAVSEFDFVNYINIQGMTITPGGTRYQYAITADGGDTNLQLHNIFEGTDEGSGVDTTYDTIVEGEHNCVLAAYLDGTDRHLAYVNEDGSIYTLSNTGSGWVDNGQEYPGMFLHLAGYWASRNYNFSSEICFLFDDGVDVYAGKYALAPDTVDDLIATGITANPVVGTPALGQEHDLTATGITANPVVGTPAITTLLEYSQPNFRIRSDDSVGINVDSGWAAAEDTNAVIDAGTIFRIRFTINGGGGTGIFKLQYNHESAGWNDLDYDGNNTAGPAMVKPSRQYVDGAVVTQLLSNGAASGWLNGEGDSAVVATSGNLATVSIDDEYTEVEFCLMIQKFFYQAGMVVDADTIEFRVVESDGTTFTGAYTNPTITVNIPDYYIGGTFAESPGRVGPFSDGNNNLYLLMESDENSAMVMMLKSTDDGVSWFEVDGAGRPSSDDMEGMDVAQVGTVLHMAHHNGSDDVVYHTFNTSDAGADPDTWVITDEAVSGSIDVLDQFTSIAVRNDTVVIFYNDAGSNVSYNIRSSGGSWGTPADLDDTNNNSYYQPFCVKEIDTDHIHVFYKDETSTTLFHRRLQENDTLDSRESVDTDIGDSTSNRYPICEPIAWKDGSVEKVMVVYAEDTNGYLMSRSWDDNVIDVGGRKALGTTSLVDRDGGNGRMPNATLTVDGTDIYCFWVYYSTREDVHYGLNENDGVWGSPIEEITDGGYFRNVRARVITHSSKVVGYLYEDIEADNDLDGYTGHIWYSELALSQDHDLTATGVTANPVVDTPALGQEHALTATGITVNPALDTPALGQEHVLTATGITANPVLDTPVLAEIHNLTANDITANPVLDTPSISQEHDLTVTEITANPVLDTPALGQEHDLTATGITANPILGTPSLSESNSLTAVDISTTPVVETPAIGQEHALDAVDISTTPVLDTPVLAETHILDAVDISTTPVVETSAIGQEHALTVTEITANPVLGTPPLSTEGVDALAAVDITANPVLDTPALGQEHGLTASDISTTPVLGTPALSQIVDLTAVDISTTPVLDTPVLAEIHNLTADNITANPVLDTPSIGQEHALIATGITADPILGTPSFSESNSLTATGITANPVLDTPSLGQEHDLTASDISTTPVLDTPSLGQEHVLDAVDISTTPVLDTPELSEIHNLTATGITTIPVLDTPVLEQEHVLSASGITATPVLGTPLISTEGEDALSAQGITATPILGTPELGQTHVLSATDISTTPTVGTSILTVIIHLTATAITATPVLDTPTLGQIHSLTASGISTTPVLDAPELSSIYVLTANGILTTPQMGTPVIGQIHVLSSPDISVSPILGVPTLGQIHIITAQGILTTPVMGIPETGIYLVEYPPDILFSAVYPTAEVNAVYPDIEINVITEV